MKGMDELIDCVIYRCVVGSRAYGLDVEGSDTDVRGIFLPPADLQWSLDAVPEQIEHRDKDEVYWELEKFLRLALKANPNILECLYTPVVEYASPLAEELLEMRSAFLSKKVITTYQRYVASQFRKLEGGMARDGIIKWKHAMHLIRLLLSGLTILREGFVPVRVERHREELLAIRDGYWSWEQLARWQAELEKEFLEESARTHLPSQPDSDRVNAFLVKARRSMVQ